MNKKECKNSVLWAVTVKVTIQPRTALYIWWLRSGLLLPPMLTIYVYKLLVQYTLDLLTFLVAEVMLQIQLLYVIMYCLKLDLTNENWGWDTYMQLWFSRLCIHGCTICLLLFCFTDCPIKGQVFQECRTCPATCKLPDILCSHLCMPGCGCPPGQLIDEEKQKCVTPNKCPSISTGTGKK